MVEEEEKQSKVKATIQVGQVVGFIDDKSESGGWVNELNFEELKNL